MKKRTRKPATATTPGKLASWLRRLWWYSPERKAVLARDGHKCCACGSRSKLNVHHIHGVNWARIRKVLFDELFCGPDKLITLCGPCHAAQEPHELVESTESTPAPEALQSTISKKTTRGMGRN